MVQKSQKSGRKKPRRSGRKGSYQAKTPRQRKSPARKTPPRIIDPGNPLDRALALMKAGMPQKAAAKAEGLSEKAVRKHREANTRSKRVRGKWVIKDRRAVYLFIFEDGQLRSFPFGKKAARKIGQFWNAVNETLLTNKPSHLVPYRDVRVRDAYNKYHVFDTDLNALRRADSIGDLSFHTVYAETVS